MLSPFFFFFFFEEGDGELCIKLLISIRDLPQRVSDLIYFLTNLNQFKKTFIETRTIYFLLTSANRCNVTPSTYKITY